MTEHEHTLLAKQMRAIQSASHKLFDFPASLASHLHFSFVHPPEIRANRRTITRCE
jgi:hypothetical protein